MYQEYARVSVEMPENKDNKSLSQELTYEIENNDINDEFSVKFWWWKRKAIPIRLPTTFNGKMPVMALCNKNAPALVRGILNFVLILVLVVPNGWHRFLRTCFEYLTLNLLFLVLDFIFHWHKQPSRCLMVTANIAIIPSGCTPRMPFLWQINQISHLYSHHIPFL